MKQYLQRELCVSLPDIKEIDSLLFRAVMDKASPSSAVNALYNLIHRPIIAFDTSFRLIACAFPRPFFFSPWEEIASTKRLSDSYIDEYDSLFFQEKMYQLGRSSYFCIDTPDICPQVDGPILSGEQLIGYVGICISCDKEIEKLTYINDRLAEALALLVPRYQDDEETVISDSLWERFLSQDEMDNKEASQLEMIFPPAYRIAMLTAQSGQIPTLQYIRGCLEHSGVPLRTYIDRNERLLILYYDIEKGPNSSKEKSFINMLEKYIDRYQLYGGLSDKFYHLKQGPVARLQADISIEIGSRLSGNNRLFDFRDQYENMLCSYAFERYGAYPVTPPVLRYVEDKDKTMPLIPTLEAFIECECNQERTAKKLGLHKNTISYRLKQLTEITGVNMSDPADILQLKLGLMMYHYSINLEKRIKEEVPDDFR